MKTVVLLVALAFSSVALADAAKSAPAASKLPREARVWVVDKEAPSIDKTVPLTHARVASKNK